MDEIWKNIEGKEGKFQVSNKGRVKSVERTVIRSNGSPNHVKEKILKPQQYDKYGHLQTDLGKYGEHDCHKIHQLVAQAFIPNPNNYTIVHHIDDNPSNNCVENLVWMSDEEHRRLHADEQSKMVYQYDINTLELLRVWEGTNEINRELGFDRSSISKCCRGVYKQIYGHIWSYTPL